MPIQATLSKWGNSLALRIPSGVARNAGLQEGDGVDLTPTSGGFAVTRCKRKKYSIGELLAGYDPATRHEEVDWDSPKGKEVW